MKLVYLKHTASVAALFMAFAAHAESFNIPSGDLKSALDAYARQTGVNLIVAGAEVNGVQTKGVQGDLSADGALSHLLRGTGFSMYRRASGAIGIMRDQSSSADQTVGDAVMLAQASPVARTSVETVTVTSSKLGGADVQSIPISITALSQEQLTATQTNGGPDLVKQVPNLTFSKTNFTGYNIQIRGIGTQAISVTTDPAVAVAFNDIPFIRNHFFEQEFYDVSNVEVLRGPQGTLYGRNATAGVVNLTSAKPTDQYEAMASLDVGNYNNRRMEGMLNIPIVGDKFDLRIAGEWTRRDGYAFNDETQHRIDGRDLWSGRVSLLVHPVDNLTANFVWEHFDENDDRARSTKQLCTRDPGTPVIDGQAGPQHPTGVNENALSLGCVMGPLYGPTAFQTPSAGALPYVVAPQLWYMIPLFANPYASLTQSQDLRTVSSFMDPKYRAKNDTFELNLDYRVTEALTLTLQTGFNKDSLYSIEDYNRFAAAPGLFNDTAHGAFVPGLVGEDGEFCDPQLGCADHLVGEDLSQERAQQFSQELRIASSFEGPLNFSAGVNYLHYQTVEDYYVFINALSLTNVIVNGFQGGFGPDGPHTPFRPDLVNKCNPLPTDPATVNSFFQGLGCAYVDPNPLGQIDGEGHNYFRSQNPYSLNSWAGFGEAYYQVTPDVKLTGGLRWTDDQKHFVVIPSWASLPEKGFFILGDTDQEWKEWTGRFNVTWTPKLEFTDQSLFYGSYSRGYKGGGANPPGVVDSNFASLSNSTHPLTFKPEFIDAFEVGTKNLLLGGALTFNADAFFYKYQNYQISQIVDRTSVNLNFDAMVKGAEVEAIWEPVPGLRVNFSGGYEDTRLANGSHAIDLMDRTAGNTAWLVVKPFITQTSNCILPKYVLNQMAAQSFGGALISACQNTYRPYNLENHLDPLTFQPYVPNPATDYLGEPMPGYIGFDPNSAPNLGYGFDKDLSGNELPNAPPFTLSAGAQYSMPVSSDWVATARADGYWQGNTFARVFNDKPYDQIHGYTNVNLSLIFTNQDGWQAMAYMKNVFDTTAITGAFLNTDDTGLTTNIFVTDPRLFGIRLTKNW